MARNTERLMAKARKIYEAGGVEKFFGDNWTVTSTSGKPYEVSKNEYGDMTCTCKWAQTRSHGFGSGCSHTLAVEISIEASKGRAVAAHDSRQAADRQKRPKIYMGGGLWATTRATATA